MGTSKRWPLRKANPSGMTSCNVSTVCCLYFQVLTVQHPLEESRETLAFATEPVFASLANVLGHTENMPVPPPSGLKDYKLYDVEIKYGLMQVYMYLNFFCILLSLICILYVFLIYIFK